MANKDYTTGYCSWCYKENRHYIKEEAWFTRNVYWCDGCHCLTVKCRYCDNLAKYSQVWEQESWFTKGDELCAEHSGEVPNFTKLGQRIYDLERYTDVYEREAWNLAKVGKIGSSTLGFMMLAGGAAYLAAPAVASTLGATGVLGSASTGTAINSLSGAALQSASLAALGGGTMAGGFGVITAAGGALGGIRGAAIASGYLGDIKDFGIEKIIDGEGPSVIFIDGFLTQKSKDENQSEWSKGAADYFRKNPKFHVTWESKCLLELGSWATKRMGKKAFHQAMKELSKRAGRKLLEKALPWNWISTVSDLFGNPWHTAMVKAAMTGQVLADIIARTESEKGFILVGHSLGARVIFYTLAALATKDEKKIHSAYLLGGAVGRDPEWLKVQNAVQDKIYNFYSDNDLILKGMYQSANLFQSEPIGLGPIKAGKVVKNLDVTDLVGGHTHYKPHFPELLQRVKKQASFNQV